MRATIACVAHSPCGTEIAVYLRIPDRIVHCSGVADYDS